MKSENYAPSVTEVGLTEELKDLEQKQTAFHDTFMIQAEANAELRRQGSASGLRRELEMSLRSYYAYVWAMRAQSGWDVLYAKLAELVKAAKNTVGKPEKELTKDEIELKEV